jgi:hypothetical protein
MSFTKTGRFVLALVCLAVLAGSASAQRPRGGRRGPGGMIRMMLPLEQTLGNLAFDKEMALTDAQLIQIRNELKAIGVERDKLAEEMGSGGADRQAMMANVGKLRAGMVEGLKGVLDDRQDALFDGYLKRLQQMRERFQQGGRSGPRGGGE